MPASRDLVLWLCCRFVATIGIQMQSVAVGWQIWGLTRDPMALGYVGLAQFLPLLLLSLVAGSVADRFDRKVILAGCYAIWAAGCAALAGITWLGGREVWPMYVVLVLLGSARAFAGPAGQSFLPHLVPAEQYPRALALSSSTWQIAVIVGPSVGGVIYGLTDSAAPVYATSIVLELVAAATMLSIRARPGELERGAVSLQSLVAGVRYVYQNKMILGAISLDLFAVLFGGAVALLPAIARDQLHTGPWGLGLLRSAPAVGALVTALWLAWRPIRTKVGMRMFVSVGIYGVAIIAFGLSESLFLSLAALAVSGAADMVSVFTRHNLVQLGTPNAMRGRVSAVSLVFISASNELGEFESGLAAKLLGVTRSIVLGGTATIVIVLTWMRLFPTLRQVDELPKAPPPS